MEPTLIDLFVENTEKKNTKHGCEINCRKGLWGVTAPTEDQAVSEAMHYFIQYLEDGVYETGEER